MSRITHPVGGQVANPNRSDVLLIQSLLNKNRPIPMLPIAENGIDGPETRAAIAEFQTRVMKMHRPDGKVDPGGATFRALSKVPVAPISVVFRKLQEPTGVTGLPGADDVTTATRYESSVTVTGGVKGQFRGTIFPDDMDVKGRLKDGTYNISLGFHKPGTPKATDLVVRTKGFRAVLVINGGNSVPVASNDKKKTTSDGVHIHNGWSNWTAAKPMSEGCLLIAPGDWSNFLQLFLDAFPDLSDWSTHGSRVGKKIGTVTVVSS